MVLGQASMQKVEKWKVFCFLKYMDTSVKSRICIGMIMWAGHLAYPSDQPYVR